MTVADRTTREKLMAELPDIPKWLETRWMLTLETTEITGLDAAPRAATAGGVTDADPITFLISSILNPAGALQQHGRGGVVVRDPPTGLISVIGEPPHEVIRAAVDASDTPDVIAQVENAGWAEKALPDLPRTTAKLHWLVDSARLLGPLVPETNMFGLPEQDYDDDDSLTMLDRPEFLSTADVTELAGARDHLKRELTIAVLRGPVVGVKDGGRPVSFCHAEIQTEKLWDVAIETLEGFRGKGYAEKAVAHMANHMLETYQKRPVWGALETNEPSLRLAAKLGFRPIEEVVVFEPD